jgi:hypothetical protein
VHRETRVGEAETLPENEDGDEMRERRFPGITPESDTMGDAVRRTVRAWSNSSLPPKPGIPIY